MKKVLVVYYTQSGQLLEILRSLMGPLEESGRVSVTYEELRPVPKFPFPWKPLEFFSSSMMKRKTSDCDSNCHARE